MGGEEPRAGGDSIARNTAFAFAVQVTTAAFTAVLTLFLVRSLGAHGYGAFALALSLASLVALPADFGLAASAARFIAEHRGDRPAIARVTREALRLKIVFAGLVSLGLVALAGTIASAYGDHSLAWPLRGAAVSLFGQSMFAFFRNSFVAQAKASASFAIVASESAIETGASIGLVLLGAGATGAMFGRSAGYVLGALLGLVLTTRLLGSSVLSLRRAAGPRTEGLGRYAAALMVIDGSFILFSQIDSVLIGAFLTTSAVGVFNAPMRLLVLLHYPGLAIANGVAPRLARHRRDGPNVAAFVRALRYLLLFQAFTVAPLVVWADPIARLTLGGGYGESADVLRALAPFVYMSGPAALLSLGINYLGEARRRVPIAVVTVLIALGIDLVLIPRIGIVGAAIGTDVGYLLYSPAHLWACRRVIDLPLRPLLLAVGRSLLAAAVMAAVLLALGTSSHLELWRWLAGGLGGPLAFLAVLLATRELRFADLRSLRPSA